MDVIEISRIFDSCLLRTFRAAPQLLGSIKTIESLQYSRRAVGKAVGPYAASRANCKHLERDIGGSPHVAPVCGPES